jgi:flagellin-like protein
VIEKRTSKKIPLTFTGAGENAHAEIDRSNGTPCHGTKKAVAEIGTRLVMIAVTLAGKFTRPFF